MAWPPHWAILRRSPSTPQAICTSLITENGRVVEVSCLLVAGTTSQGIGTVIATKGYTTSPEGITGVAVDSMGNIYIPDGYAGTDPSRIIKVTAAGAASLLTPTGITFSRPEGVTADGMGNLYIADGGHNRIVEITTAGVASVLAIEQPSQSDYVGLSLWHHGGPVWEPVYSGLG